ncbi:hypothetical protein [Pseudoxanthomonas putridarboris]|uniref:Poly(Hydroxyalkanoate) granule-associated protein n=1 Tax=Pseudoxanthomonas putridarboris TaxID=752605 RepID=A0ABU9IZ90_9GAMM
MPVKKKSRAKTPEPTLRHVWLAGLGLAAVARREAITAANDAAARVVALRRQAGKLASDTQANVLGGIASVREQGEARVGQFSAEVEARLAPVLSKLGLKPARKTAKPRARKVAKKAPAKRARATPARKPAAKRTVRRRSA